MGRSLCPTEWKPEASTGKRSQGDLALVGLTPMPHLLDEAVLDRISFSGALNESAKHSGMEDYQIADQLHMSHGYMSRFMRGVGQQWARRTVGFMHHTRSRAPAQWIAHQVGCDLVVRSSREARIRELELELARTRAS